MYEATTDGLATTRPSYIQAVPEESSSMEGIKPDGDKSGKYKDGAGQEMQKARYQSKLLISTSLFQVTMCLYSFQQLHFAENRIFRA